MDAPTASELQANPVVQAAFAAAWADSFADDQTLQHEEGGFIYSNSTTGEITIRRAAPGGRDFIDLSFPPAVLGAYVVATYHTHALRPRGPITAEPSDDDRFHAVDSGVPWFVISHEGVFVTGPIRRVGGLTGPNGYPL